MSSHASPMQAMLTELSITKALRRPRCGTSTSTVEVLCATPVRPSTSDLQARNVFQCLSSEFCALTTKRDAPESNAHAPDAICAHALASSGGMSTAALQTSWPRNLGKPSQEHPVLLPRLVVLRKQSWMHSTLEEPLVLHEPLSSAQTAGGKMPTADCSNIQMRRDWACRKSRK